MDRKTLLMIINPRAGRSKPTGPLLDAAAVFSEGGYLLSLHKTSAPRDAMVHAAKYGGDYDVVVAVGGTAPSTRWPAA